MVRLAMAGLLLVYGCGEDRRPDAGDSAVGTDGGGPDGFVTSPAPVVVSCPPGWQEASTATGITSCEPWAAGTDTRCPVGQGRFPGGAGCEIVGPPCPAGDLPEGLPSDRTVIFVSTNARPVGRDGSRDNPFRDLTEAFAAASGGELLALSKGRHRVGAIFPEDIDIWGACAAETELVAEFTDEATGTVTAVEGARVELQRLAIVGAQPGLRVDTGATLVVRDVIVRGSGLAGAFVLDGTFIADNFVVRDSAPRDGQFGRALQVQAGGSAEVRRGVFEAVHDIAVQVVDVGSRATLEDVAIRDVTPDEGADLGRAIEISTGGTTTLERVVIEDVRDSGLFVGGGDVTATDVVVRGVRENSAGTFGRGLHVEGGGHLTGTRIAVHDTRELGVYGSGEGTTLDLSDVVVEGTQPRYADGEGGRGIQVQWGIAVTLHRVHLDANVDVGLFIASEGTQVTASDLDVSRTAESPVSGRGRGRGLEVILGARLALDRARFTENHDIGLFLSDGPVTLMDVEVTGTRYETGTGWYGRGVIVRGTAEVSGSRLLVRGNTEMGVYVRDGRLTMSDVRVEGTLAQPCLVDCGGRNAGVGLTVLGGTAAITNVELTDNVLAGVVIDDGGRAQLSGGVISGHPVAIYTADDPDVALGDLVGVELRDNQRNFDARTLPVPDTSVPGEIEF